MCILDYRRYFLLKPSWFHEISFWTYCHSIALLYHLNMFLSQMGCCILHLVSLVVQDPPPLAFRTPMFTKFGVWSNCNELLIGFFFTKGTHLVDNCNFIHSFNESSQMWKSDVTTFDDFWHFLKCTILINS